MLDVLTKGCNKFKVSNIMRPEKTLYSEFHLGLKPGQATISINHSNPEERKPSVEVVCRFPFKIVTEEGEVYEAGTMMKLSFWARVAKSGRVWHSGGVSAVGEKFYRGGSSTSNGSTGTSTSSGTSSGIGTGASVPTSNTGHGTSAPTTGDDLPF